MMKRLCSIITLLVSFLLLTGKIQARITMPSLFGRYGVATTKLVAIWGSSDRKKQRITVKPSWSNKEYTTVSDDLGRWKMKLETPVYGGPYNIEVSDGETVRLSNILIGEVWLCSGRLIWTCEWGGRYDEPVIGSLMRLLLLEILKYVCLRWMVRWTLYPWLIVKEDGRRLLLKLFPISLLSGTFLHVN